MKARMRWEKLPMSGAIILGLIFGSISWFFGHSLGGNAISLGVGIFLAVGYLVIVRLVVVFFATKEKYRVIKWWAPVPIWPRVHGEYDTPEEAHMAIIIELLYNVSVERAGVYDQHGKEHSFEEEVV